MLLKFLLLALVTLSYSLFAAGQDTDYEESGIWNKNKGHSFEAKCVRKFLHCISSSSSTVEQFIQAQKKCCVEKLNDSQAIWFVTFNHCVERETFFITNACLFKLEFGCVIQTANYFERTFSDFMQFRKDISDRIQPLPTAAEDCNDSFVMNFSIALIEQCKVNTDKNLDVFCNSTTNVFYEHKPII